MDPKIERIKYLTKKAQKNVISPEERDELAHLLGRQPQEFRETDGLDQLIAIALVAITAAIILWLLNRESG